MIINYIFNTHITHTNYSLIINKHKFLKKKENQIINNKNNKKRCKHIAINEKQNLNNKINKSFI